jgi:hypothetical protein
LHDFQTCPFRPDFVLQVFDRLCDRSRFEELCEFWVIVFGLGYNLLDFPHRFFPLIELDLMGSGQLIDFLASLLEMELDLLVAV